MILGRRVRATVAALDRLVDATPPSRERAVDLLRVGAIGIVVLWHWALSLTHRRDGQLVNPNPIDDVPGSWLLTWVFQVMPLFFVVGGYANLAGWDSMRRAGGRTARFLARRLRRLLGPALVFAAVWLLLDLLLGLTRPDYPGTLTVAPILFTPLWFLGAYVWVVLLVPVTATVHRRWGVVAVVGLGVILVAADVARLRYGVTVAGALNTALVWVFAHQLGYLWRDGSLRPAWRGWVLAAGGLAVTALATSAGPYPRSLVAVPGEELSHMLPTTAVIGALAVTQTGLASLLAPALSRWLRQRRPWRVVTAANAVVLTIFLWHMTALLAVFVIVEGLGFAPGSQPTATWWLARPFWLVAPAVVLAVLIAVFGPVERRLAAGPRPRAVTRRASDGAGRGAGARPGVAAPRSRRSGPPRRAPRAASRSRRGRR